jgi:hypothetical protein
MKKNKPKRDLEIKHSELKNKIKEYFHRKLNEIHIQQKRFVNTNAVLSKALLPSYQISFGITQNKKPHTFPETVILPVVIDMVQTMFSEKCVQ